MDIQTTKLELMRLMLNTEKEQVLQRIKDILVQGGELDFWDELDEKLKASIDRGLEQTTNGQVKSHEQVMKKYKQWL